VSEVTIIGAGLAGSLLAMYLAKRGMAVDVYEARGDMRLEGAVAGRSINLALSDRGIAALREVGLDEYMLAEAVPMFGRMVHSPAGETRLLPYSGRQGEYINSVSRAGLNIALMSAAERHENVTFHFNRRCVDFDCASGQAVFSDGERSTSETVIATDGAGSAVRNAMMHGGIDRFDFSQKWLEHGYKELHIPPLVLREDKANSRFAMTKDVLHIWPRHKFMMIALPNFDGSFTCTLFLSHKSANDDVEAATRPKRGFDQLAGEHEVREFFVREFPDAIPLMPTLVQDFFHNPTGNLGTVKCFPWSLDGKALLLGDSAHAVVPFYGQGMNCAFEDVRVLDGLIESHGADWTTVYREYGRLRKPNTDAIADMAEENFYEMRDAVADPVFLRKRELETKLEQTFPDYFSKYSMVTFREDLPYSVAKERGNAQDRILMEICERVDDVSQLAVAEVLERLRELR
jgi:kynurenine 3-monooxygenase